MVVEWRPRCSDSESKRTAAKLRLARMAESRRMGVLLMPPRSAALKWGSLEVPWPSWASGPLAVIVLLGLGGFGWFWALDRIDTESKRISPADLVQLEEAQRHLTEAPAGIFTVFDDPRGGLFVRYFSSDSCTLVERRFPNAPTTTRFVPDLSRAVQAKRQDRPVYFGASPAWAGGRCLTLQEHGEPVKTWSEPIDSCQVRAVRLYGDGCRATAIWNSCLSTWSAWAFDVCRH